MKTFKRGSRNVKRKWQVSLDLVIFTFQSSIWHRIEPTTLSTPLDFAQRRLYTSCTGFIRITYSFLILFPIIWLQCERKSHADTSQELKFTLTLNRIGRFWVSEAVDHLRSDTGFGLFSVFTVQFQWVCASDSCSCLTGVESSLGFSCCSSSTSRFLAMF